MNRPPRHGLHAHDAICAGIYDEETGGEGAGGAPDGMGRGATLRGGGGVSPPPESMVVILDGHLRYSRGRGPIIAVPGPMRAIHLHTWQHLSG